MCSVAIETADHLLLNCPFAAHIWNYFRQLLGVNHLPVSLGELWGEWRRKLTKPSLPFWDLLVKAINWNIWLERNARIFNFNCLSSDTIILKIIRMLMSWYFAAPESKKAKIEDSVTKIRRNLDFLVPRDAVHATLRHAHLPLAISSSSLLFLYS